MLLIKLLRRIIEHTIDFVFIGIIDAIAMQRSQRNTGEIRTRLIIKPVDILSVLLKHE